LIKSIFKTKLGEAINAEANEYMTKRIKDESIDLIMTSPPFALITKKGYGNKNQDEYMDWFKGFIDNFRRILKPKGSLVIDIAGTWIEGQPSKSLIHLEIPMILCKEYDFNLAQDFFWWNTNKLPSPAEWVTIRRERVKDAVNNIWWFSKDPHPKADNTKVLKEYSKAQMGLFEEGKFTNTGKRPSAHKVSKNFSNKNEGSIPPNVIKVDDFGGEVPTNLFDLGNSRTSAYNEYCREKKLEIHPAKFPQQIPEFFIKMLTDKGDKVYDPFGGSCTTGVAAEGLGRKWICTDLEREYLLGAKGWFGEDYLKAINKKKKRK
jgi:site-specific DNA-methyltransferase (cytosine-N4-specific)